MSDINKDLMGLVEGRKRQSGGRDKLSELFSSDEEEEGEFVKVEAKPDTTTITTTRRSRQSPVQRTSTNNEEGEFSDGFDEDLMGDEEDRKRLAIMTEVEREAVLYERAQVRLAKIERRELEKKVQAMEKSQMTKAMGLAKKAAPTSSGRGGRRARQGTTASSDSDYIEEDEDVRPSRYAPAGRRKAESGRIDEAAILKNSIDLPTANQLVLSRGQVAQWIYHPRFDEVARGCLVRLAIYKGNQQVYRVTEIKRIVKYHRAYVIDDSLITNKAAVLKYGKSEKTFRLDVISNSPFTQEEFDRWLKTLMEEHQPIITHKMAENRIASWKSMEESHLTDDIVSAMVAAKRDVGALRRNPVAERTMLLHLREEALASNNAEELERIDDELDQLQSMSQESSSSSQSKERERLLKRSRFVNMNVSSASGTEKHLDPFSRRKTQPTDFNVFFEDSSLSPPNGETILKVPKPEHSPNPGFGSQSDQSSKSPAIAARAENISKSPIDSLMASTNVDIQIDLIHHHRSNKVHDVESWALENLQRLEDLNKVMKLMSELDRIPVSEACKLVVDYMQGTDDVLLFPAQGRENPYIKKPKAKKKCLIF